MRISCMLQKLLCIHCPLVTVFHTCAPLVTTIHACSAAESPTHVLVNLQCMCNMHKMCHRIVSHVYSEGVEVHGNTGN